MSKQVNSPGGAIGSLGSQFGSCMADGEVVLVLGCRGAGTGSALLGTG